MSLIYLVTGLPRLRRGQPPPIARDEFVRRCRDALVGRERRELERLVQIEAVEETVRLTLAGQLAADDAREIAGAILSQRRDGLTPDDLPDWLRQPGAQHQLMRRHYFELTQHAETEFLRRWANFRVDIGEIITAVLCRVEGMSRDAFLVQMQGSFDASAPLIIKSWDDPNLGLGQRFPWMPTVISALQDDDLLAMSRRLDDVLWAKIEQISDHATFSVETLLAFYLQLRILERESSWDAARGAAVLDRILSLSTTASAANTPPV